MLWIWSKLESPKASKYRNLAIWVFLINTVLLAICLYLDIRAYLIILWIFVIAILIFKHISDKREKEYKAQNNIQP